MAKAEFRTNDEVRLVGTDTIHTVRQYNAETLEYQIRHGQEEASAIWILGAYLEPVNPA
jgi:hypothetical protein